MAPAIRRVGVRQVAAGPLRAHQFLDGVAKTTRTLLPAELRDFQHRLRGPLVKLHYEDRSQHYEIWLRRSASLVELGLHFESSDRGRNARMLDWFSEELALIKGVLGERTEAEPWDRGWTRVHRVLALEPLDLAFQQRLAEQLAQTIELLEPLRREANE